MFIENANERANHERLYVLRTMECVLVVVVVVRAAAAMSICFYASFSSWFTTDDARTRVAS